MTPTSTLEPPTENITPEFLEGKAQLRQDKTGVYVLSIEDAALLHDVNIQGFVSLLKDSITHIQGERNIHTPRFKLIVDISKAAEGTVLNPACLPILADFSNEFKQAYGALEVVDRSDGAKALIKHAPYLKGAITVHSSVEDTALAMTAMECHIALKDHPTRDGISVLSFILREPPKGASAIVYKKDKPKKKTDLSILVNDRANDLIAAIQDFTATRKARGVAQHLVVDLREVKYMNPDKWPAIVAANKTARQKGHRLYLLVNEQNEALLQKIGYKDMPPFFSSVDELEASLAQAAMASR